MKIGYKTVNFRNNSFSLIAQANDIIAEYLDAGYELTLRQLYYQFVARGLIPNKKAEYKKLGTLINNGRLAGEIDWSAIVDRTRKVEMNSHWNSPQEILQSTADSYAIDTRATQSVYVEAWVEKEALVGILERVCEPLDVPYFSCRGYVSQSAMWRAAERIGNKEEIHHEFVVLYLGDHDPSGLDMPRDIQERFELFGVDVRVKRIALTFEQIEQYNPPPNPAKTTDSRYWEYRQRHGDESWELDALDPRTISDLISHEVQRLTDGRKRMSLIGKQTKQRKKLQKIADRYTD